ncbi:MAG: hypothetical protein Q9178_006335 [Gyalolechia marmorata]
MAAGFEIQKRKAAERKALRIAQQTGKGERREARDEEMRVYRDIKLIWKVIREQYVKETTMLKAVENVKPKKMAMEVNEAKRKTPLKYIKPQKLGMRGREVDPDPIPASKVQSNVEQRRGKRVDLGEVAKPVNETYVPIDDLRDSVDYKPFIKFDVSESQDHEALNLNHKLRRRLRRALDNAQIQKKMLVRQRVVDHLKAKGIAIPKKLLTNGKAKNFKGTRILED